MIPALRFASLRTRANTLLVCLTPRAAVGSSRITTFTSLVATRAIATDCFCPPDKSPIDRS